MIDVLSEKTIRILLDNEQPITSKDIALETGMSISSVKHNMDYVRHLLHQNGAILHSIPGKGIWLQATPEQKQQIFTLLNEHRDKSYSFAYRKNYILGILFQSRSNYTIQLFADDLGVGRNIINRDLDQIQKWLTYFDLMIIKTRNRGVFIEGDEFNIRQAIIYNNTFRLEEIQNPIDNKPSGLDFRIDLRFYHYFIQTYKSFPILYIQQLICDAELFLQLRYDDVSFTQLMEYIAISLERLLHHHVITKHNLLIHCEIRQQDWDAAKKLFDTSLPNTNETMDIEIRCLAAQFLLHGSYDLATSMIKEVYYDEMARVFLEQLKWIIINKRLNISHGLISDVGLFFQKKKLQKSFQMLNSSAIRQDVKKRFPSLYGMVLTNIQQVERKLKVKFTENDLAYLVMLLDNAMEDNASILHTLFISSHDWNTLKYLENKIKRSVPEINITQMVSENDISSIKESDYDLVLTTTPTTVNKALKISRHVDPSDLVLIKQHAKKILMEKQAVIMQENTVFEQALIAHHVVAKQKEEVIQLGAKLLIDHQYVKEDFLQVLLQRESITATSIGNGIAIPHGYKDCIVKSGVAVLVLEHPINWTEEDKVDLVFLIAIDFQTNQEVNHFFSQFYQLIDKQEMIETIRHASTTNQILKILKETGIAMITK